MKIIYSARKQEQEDTQYLPLDVQGLTVTTEHLGGTGAVNTPKRLRVTLQNVSGTRWSGVVRIEFCKKAENAKVFMPGFMYGRNRAENSHESEKGNLLFRRRRSGWYEGIVCPIRQHFFMMVNRYWVLVQLRIG